MRNRVWLLPALLAVGCSPDAEPTGELRPEPPRIGTAFDPERTGSITGRVTWPGPLPAVPQTGPAGVAPNTVGFELFTPENPNRPRIDPHGRAVAGAVVFLRGVDPAASRPWDLPPVRVEMGGGRIVVVQGERRDRVGFVRRGDTFTAQSVEAVPHALRARGDAFFTLPLPDPNRPATRTLDAPGRVELSSGTGLYWARADLFVADHPYFTVTDKEGHFSLDRVPAGRVGVVAWLPGWDVAKRERNPDSLVFTTLNYTPPIERTAAVLVEPGKAADANFVVP